MASLKSIKLKKLVSVIANYSWRLINKIPQIFGMSNPSCTRARSYHYEMLQTLRWLADVWYRPFLGISSRHRFACFCWWHLQNCFGNHDDSFLNRYSSYFVNDLRSISKYESTCINLSKDPIDISLVPLEIVLEHRKNSITYNDIPLSKTLIFCHSFFIQLF